MICFFENCILWIGTSPNDDDELSETSKCCDCDKADSDTVLCRGRMRTVRFSQCSAVKCVGTEVHTVFKTCVLFTLCWELYNTVFPSHRVWSCSTHSVYCIVCTGSYSFVERMAIHRKRVIGLLEVGGKWGKAWRSERTTRNSNSTLGASFAPASFAREEFYDYLFLPSTVYRNIQHKQFTLAPSSF